MKQQDLVSLLMPGNIRDVILEKLGNKNFQEMLSIIQYFFFFAEAGGISALILVINLNAQSKKPLKLGWKFNINLV